jgi:hypothetical protein
MSPPNSGLTLTTMLSNFARRVSSVDRLSFEHHDEAMQRMFESVAEGDKRVSSDLKRIIALAILDEDTIAFMARSCLLQSHSDDRRRRNVHARVSRVLKGMQAEMKRRALPASDGAHVVAISAVPQTKKRPVDLEQAINQSVRTLMHKHRKSGPSGVYKMQAAFREATLFLDSQLEVFQSNIDEGVQLVTPLRASAQEADTGAGGGLGQEEETEAMESDTGGEGGLGLDGESE